MKFYKYIQLALLMVFMLFAFACGSDKETPGPTPVIPPEPEPEPTEQHIGDMDWQTLSEGETNELLVSGVGLPAKLSGVIAGEDIRITGKGFTSADKIVFRPIDALDTSKDKVSAVKSADTNGVIFNLPGGITNGNYRLLVMRQTQEQKLGVVYLVCDNLSTLPGMNVKGRILCGGNPVAKVVVSDGFLFTVTDSDGWYYLASEKKSGYVFMVIPSGYEAATSVLTVPQFFGRVEAGRTDIVNFELKKVQNDRFDLFVFTDIHLSKGPGNDLTQYKDLFVPKAKQTIAASHSKIYGLTMGDMTTDTRWYVDNFSLPGFLEQAGQLGLPIFYTMGNHDNDPYLPGDWNAASTYRFVVGPSYYSFNLGKWHFISLDNILYYNAAGGPGSTAGADDYESGLADEVFDWLVNDLTFVDADTPVLLYMHCSAKRILPADVDRLFRALEGRKVHILSGHHHTMEKFRHNGLITEHNCPPPMGVRWTVYTYSGVHITNDGSPGGYFIYSFDGKKMTWKFHTTDYGDYQFRAYDMNVVPADYGGAAGSNKIVLNIFDWDESWSVEITENGTPLFVSQTPMRDPLYHKIYTDYPIGTSSVNTPKVTSHMFSATATTSNAPVVIRVTDHNGVVHTENMTRPKALTINMK